MTTKEYQKKGTLAIFLHFFKRHRRLFALDMVCALIVALIDLAYPLLSRFCMTRLLPQRAFTAFFTVIF